ncbi:hypothetical protein A9Q84_10055 [Halobacteriovorax marinus]|uniref:Integral membrane protein n=1 Tax=Halobacteriovorax marinus TaxID=97084 RepID=A0A1Y5F702_9BACT|nr:hypothetical protein A9Q84_10055 [Halobacteriovorax marinus]
MRTKDLLVGAALLGLSAILPNATSAMSSSSDKGEEEMTGKCQGINSCKGTGACSGKTNSCAGHNSCKGKGWVKVTKKQCMDKGGTFDN